MVSNVRLNRTSLAWEHLLSVFQFLTPAFYILKTDAIRTSSTISWQPTYVLVFCTTYNFISWKSCIRSIRLSILSWYCLSGGLNPWLLNSIQNRSLLIVPRRYRNLCGFGPNENVKSGLVQKVFILKIREKLLILHNQPFEKDRQILWIRI